MKVLAKIIGSIWGVMFLTFFIVMFFGRNNFPTFLVEYSIYFESAIVSFLKSPMFFVVFVLGWFYVNHRLGRDSGWKTLAETYPDKYSETKELEYYTGSGYIGKTSNNGILKVAVDHEGIFLKKTFLFSAGHKPIFIPWREINKIHRRSALVPEKNPKTLRKTVGLFSRKTYRKIELETYPHQNLLVSWLPEFDNFVPSNISVGFDL